MVKEELLNKLQTKLRRSNLGGTIIGSNLTVDNFEDDEDFNPNYIYISLDTYLVSDDPRGCVDDIICIVENNFSELEFKEFEVFEMISVIFELK